MVTASPDDRPALSPNGPAAGIDRYVPVSLRGGDVMIYDRENHGAYIQSDGDLLVSGMA